MKMPKKCSRSVWLLILGFVAIGGSAHLMAQDSTERKPGDTPLSTAAPQESPATPEVGEKLAREQLIKQIETITAKQEVLKHIANGLSQSNTGTADEAIKCNLCTLWLSQESIALLPPIVEAVAEYNSSIQFSLRRNENDLRRYAALDRGAQADIERAAKQVLEMRATFARMKDNSDRARFVAERIDAKCRYIGELLKQRDELAKYRTENDQDSKAKLAELQELQSLDVHLNELAAQEKVHVARALVASENAQNHVVAMEQQGLRDAIRHALGVLRGGRNGSPVTTPLDPLPPTEPLTSVPVKGVDNPPPPIAIDPRVEEIVRETERKLNAVSKKVN